MATTQTVWALSWLWRRGVGASPSVFDLPHGGEEASIAVTIKKALDIDLGEQASLNSWSIGFRKTNLGAKLSKVSYLIFKKFLLCAVEVTHNCQKWYILSDLYFWRIVFHSVFLLQGRRFLSSSTYYASVYRHTSFYCYRYFAFYTLKICGNSGLGKSFSAIFNSAMLALCLCHILLVLQHFKLLSLLYFLWWSVISDVWCCYCDLLKA